MEITTVKKLHTAWFHCCDISCKGKVIGTNVGSSLEVGGGGRVGGDSARTVSLQQNTGEFGGGVGADWTALHLVCLGGCIVTYMCANSQNYTLKCVRLTVNKIHGN